MPYTSVNATEMCVRTRPSDWFGVGNRNIIPIEKYRHIFPRSLLKQSKVRFVMYDGVGQHGLLRNKIASAYRN